MPNHTIIAGLKAKGSYTGADTLDEPITTTIVSYSEFGRVVLLLSASEGERSLLHLCQTDPGSVPSTKQR